MFANSTRQVATPTVKDLCLTCKRVCARVCVPVCVQVCVRVSVCAALPIYDSIKCKCIFKHIYLGGHLLLTHFCIQLGENCYKLRENALRKYKRL